MKTEIIERKSKPFAVVPLKEFERLRHDAEMLDDIRAYDAAKSGREETFPTSVADGLMEGNHPIRVFRRYRGMTQEQLAKTARVARAYVAQLETGKKQASVAVLRSIAKALKVELDDIAG